MIVPSSSNDLFIPNRCLAVFVDDTGHEALVSGHPVYGLGGCAVLGRDLSRRIWEPWKRIRQRVTGSPDTPLHASEFSRIATSSDMEAVAEFFRIQQFFRFGAVFTKDTKVNNELSIMRNMKEILQARVNQIVKNILCKEIKIMFELSERADQKIHDEFQHLKFYRGDNNIPVEGYFIPKAAGEPALEVADFIMHAIGRQVRQNLQSRAVFASDFQAVFHHVDQRLVSYVEVATID